jgi:hypothetical protein
MSDIANRRVFLERANMLVKKSQPTLEDLSAVADALAQVMTDILGADCQIICKVDAKALKAAIARAEAEERGAA